MHPNWAVFRVAIPVITIFYGAYFTAARWVLRHAFKNRRPPTKERPLLVSVKQEDVEIVHEAQLAPSAKLALFHLLGVRPPTVDEKRGAVARG